MKRNTVGYLFAFAILSLISFVQFADEHGQRADALSAEVPAGFVRVVSVTDGDTIDVAIDGEVKRVRLIGINTPETVDPRKPVQCFGRESSDHAKAALSGKNVRLEEDPTQDSVDMYGRLLRYVWIEDGTNFNKVQIADGYAYEYTYRKPYKYQKEFKAAQAAAKSARRGLWDPETCNGKK